MIANFERFISSRYLRSKRQEFFISIITVISILGVAISVMVLCITLAIMTGFTKELQAKLLNTSAHIVVREFGGPIGDWRKLSSEIEKSSPEILSVSPYTYNQAMISTPRGSRGLLIRGVANTQASLNKIDEVTSDSFDSQQLFERAEVEFTHSGGQVDRATLPPLVVGKALQRKLGLPLGVPVTILSAQMSASPRGLMPRSKKFVPVEIYSSGLVEFEEGLAYTGIREAQKFFKLGDRVSGLEVELSDLNLALEFKKELANVLESAGYSNLYLTDWTEPNKPLWDALRLEKRVYFIVLSLLILIASFSIVSTLVMMVMEKRRDIALLKTIGASSSSIKKIFLYQGITIGFLGVVLGTILGYLGCLALKKWGFQLEEAVFSLSEVPVHIIPANFALVAVVAFVITSLAGIYPAIKAGKTRPGEILRFE